MGRRKIRKQPVADGFAVQVFKATEWNWRLIHSSVKEFFLSPTLISNAAQWPTFVRESDFLLSLSRRIFERFPARPELESLTTEFRKDRPLNQMVKRFGLVCLVRNPQSRLKHVGRTALRPKSPGELASHLGLTISGLNWLTGDGKKQNANPTCRHYHLKWIRKRSDGYRLLESPKPLLKSAQRILLADVLNRFPVHPAAHGFVRGRNVLSHASQHTGASCCLSLDLKDFFPSIGGDRVFGWFRKAGYEKKLAWLLTQLCTSVASEVSLLELELLSGNSNYFANLKRRYSRPHLPQGAPTSPMLANLVAWRFDHRISLLATRLGATYTRYADDLTLSGFWPRKADYLQQKIAEIAEDEGFRLNHRKSRIMHSSQRQQVTGVVVNERPNVSRQEYDQLKAILFNACRHGLESQNLLQHPNFWAHLQGRVAWVESVNPNKGAKLRQLLEKIPTSNHAPPESSI